jgi:transcriptional regulator with XRE-family HTH domain
MCCREIQPEKQIIAMKSKSISQKLIAQRVRMVRNEIKLTQTALADLIGKDQQFIQRLESGRHDTYASNLFHIAQAVKKPVSYFMDIGEN